MQDEDETGPEESAETQETAETEVLAEPSTDEVEEKPHLTPEPPGSPFPGGERLTRILATTAVILGIAVGGYSIGHNSASRSGESDAVNVASATGSGEGERPGIETWPPDQGYGDSGGGADPRLGWPGGATRPDYGIPDGAPGAQAPGGPHGYPGGGIGER